MNDKEDLCSRCIHRAASIERMDMWKLEGARGIVSDPAPKAECKQHKGYGVHPEGQRLICGDFISMFRISLQRV